ncbi:MAG TPA: Xaa-Pro peptidase family protein [Bryobacteraceae bacterium]|nr:Xaa-Pro peptidase family protein [Bryobacteraceae bacterium]
MLNQSRLQSLTNLMTEQGWDLLLLYGHCWRKDFFRYLVNANFSGAHAAAALSRSGDVRIALMDPWDYEIVSAALKGGVCLARDFAKALGELAALSKDGGVAIGGMELMEARFVDTVRQSANRPPVSASPAVEELRRVKTPDEIERIQKAADLADRGYLHFAETVEAGMSEYELVAETEAFLKENGAEDNFMLIASGGVEVVGMTPPKDRRFEPGDHIITELTPQVDGYYAQICRTLVLGEPSAKQRESFAIFAEARQAAEDILRPGVNIADVAKAQNDVFRKYGYGEYTGPKYTRVRGHNLGLHPDESPYVLEDVNYTVKENMVIIAHPNTYLPLAGYMVFGDTLLVTSDGCTSFNKAERKLFKR